MTVAYADFLKTRAMAVQPVGVTLTKLNPMLTDWQAETVRWSAAKARTAVWADTGMGKTMIQIEWAHRVAERSLIIAPLAVCRQTEREATKLGIVARYAQNEEQARGPGVWITNYERAAAFDAAGFGAVALDEASILKSQDGSTRQALIAQWSQTPFRLACTATPAPNDVEELAGQAEWLGVTTRTQMLAAYFVHDSDEKSWRLKGHAREPMFTWMATWAVAMRNPSDLGDYDDAAWALPELTVTPVTIEHEPVPGDGMFIALSLGGVSGRSQMRRDTLAARVAATAEIVAREPDEPWLIWCGLNDESVALVAAIPGSIEVTGSMSPEEKAEKLLGFADGTYQILIVKPKIAAFGMNYQNCARVAFCGLNDSWESYYQAVRRCWRHGQKRPVNVYVVLSRIEGQVLSNVQRKEQQAMRLVSDLVAAMRKARMEIAA